ncbi:unnamed protein product [Linum trigynum]|uniref:Uncharacterized protein n=1 Tax=Linum trigynum TaxID=586398 RepID=A0AAV2GRP2_9ROSI
MYALDIPSTNLIQEEQLRNNLQLSISFSRNRMKELVMLIRSSTFKEAQSILCTVYFRCGVWTSFKTIKVNERTLRLVTWDTACS